MHSEEDIRLTGLYIGQEMHGMNCLAIRLHNNYAHRDPTECRKYCITRLGMVSLLRQKRREAETLLRDIDNRLEELQGG